MGRVSSLVFEVFKVNFKVELNRTKFYEEAVEFKYATHGIIELIQINVRPVVKSATGGASDKAADALGVHHIMPSTTSIRQSCIYVVVRRL